MKKVSTSFKPKVSSVTRKAKNSAVVTTTSASDAERGASGARALVMTVTGMDCPSCASKLTRALLTIPSVTDVKVNSFAAQASLTYTEGIVLPGDIAKRSTTLTGFKCEVVEEVKAEIQGNRVRGMRIVVGGSDVVWDNVEMPKGAEIIGVRRSVNGPDTILDILYDSAIIRPRSVVAAFANWGGTFLPTPKPKAGEQAGKELRVLFLRTIASACLCIPVLVFTWAPLSPPSGNPHIYGGCSLALASLIQIFIAAPLYSSSLRSLFFQRLIDMDLL